MNGEVNGIMEESGGTGDKQTNQNVDTCEEDDPLKNTESNNSINKSSGEPENDTQLKDSVENGGENQDKTSVMPAKDCNIDDLTNTHCSNSNESYPDSVASSQGKSEMSDHNTLHSMDRKIEDENLSKNCNDTIINDGATHEIHSDASSDEDCSIMSGGRKPEDTVSIGSDSEADESSQESQANNKMSDIILIENDNRSESQNGSASPEIQEIPSDNDDCVVTNDENNRRRSTRCLKRKNYVDLENGEDESDIEEVELEDPLTGKSKPIVVSNTKTLVEMSAKKIKLNQNNDNQKDPTVVTIDSNSGKKQSSGKTPTAQELYKTIVARGTTVTPISSKVNTNIAAQTSTPNTQPSILPSLTDDMFVVEAPSFIVPYVYEKPSMKPFREFVDKLGKELEEQKAKEEEERLQKEKLEKEKRDQLRKEKKERGEEVSASEDEAAKDEKVDDDIEKKKKKADKKEKRRRRNNDDDDSWDGESTSESEEDETLSDDDTVVIKDKADSIEEIKDVTELTAEKVCSGKSDNYFDCSLGKFFVNIGLSLVQEHVQSDLLRQQNRKLYREKKSGHNTRETQCAIASLMKNLEFSKENNAPYVFKQKKCEFCSFKTESALVMDHHLETPHMKNNLYKCNFCEFEIRSPHDILSHMESVHKVRGKLERAPSYHQCTNCPFEDNGKGKLARHQIACAKRFKPDLNLGPPVDWEPPAKIPKITRARNTMTGSYQNAFSRQVANNMLKTPINIANLMGSVSASAGVGSLVARGRSPLATGARVVAPHGAPIIRAGLMGRHTAASAGLMPNNYPLANNGKSKSLHQPSISITPLPRQPQPAPPQPTSHSKNTFVICEICDGYIKDLEQLRNHMQWIHKVKIHPKMIYNRPPLNCQKCQFRFFTDQGLERHLLGSHGLVTSSMQEAANKGKDAGRCPVCGRVYQWKLLNHVARDHNLTLKPAHLSYKCTVCTATFGMYKQFENHVYSAHSVVAKRVMDKGKVPPGPASKANDHLLKPLKINDEITIIPQPAKPATSTKTK